MSIVEGKEKSVPSANQVVLSGFSSSSVERLVASTIQKLRCNGWPVPIRAPFLPLPAPLALREIAIPSEEDFGGSVADFLVQQ